MLPEGRGPAIIPGSVDLSNDGVDFSQSSLLLAWVIRML